MLPEIVPSSEVYGYGRPAARAGVPIAGILGDQQAATFGQAASSPASPRTPTAPATSCCSTPARDRALAARPAHHRGVPLGDEPAHYALEGSIAVTGSLVQWLRDNLGIINVARRGRAAGPSPCADNGGAYFVPAFSGLFAPYWRPDARGALVGLTRFVNQAHIARAAIEAVAFQSRDVIDAIVADTGVTLTELQASTAA